MIKILAIAGLLVSVYALYTKIRMGKDHGYKPLCDFSKNVSCSVAFKSKAGKLFLLPNPVWGILAYGSLLIINWQPYIIGLSAIMVIVSLYLAYELFRLKTICIVCFTTYAINIALLIASFL